MDIKRSLNAGVGELTIMHDMDIDKIAELVSNSSFGIEITGMEENTIEEKKK